MAMASFKPATGNGTETYIIHTDHLGGTNVLTDQGGEVAEVSDYYPYGSQRISSGEYAEQRKFTGHEYDAGVDLTYMHARHYDGNRGRFLSQDSAFLAAGSPALETITNRKIDQYLADPQGLNSYSYARNNPLKNIDSTGEWFETAVDIVSVGLSAREYHNNPSFLNGLFLGADIAGSVLPIPAVIGYIRHGDKARDMHNALQASGMSNAGIVRFGIEYAKNIGFKFTSRAWSQGRIGDNLGSLADHYVRHGEGVGADSVADYYAKANNFIDGGYTNVFKEGTDTVYYNADTKVAAYVNRSGEISSFYDVTDPKKVAAYEKIINK